MRRLRIFSRPGAGVGPDVFQMHEWLCGLPDLPPDAAVLDAGCGDGSDLRLMAERLGPGARLVGLNLTRPLLEAARSATPGDARFAFGLADLSRPWPFADGAFDLVYSCNVLECITDKPFFLRETHRVLKPGGQVVCAHWDWDTQTVDGPDKALVRRIVAAFSDWQQAWMPAADGWMGRRLWPAFQASGVFTGAVWPHVLTNTQFAAPYFGHQMIETFAALARRGLVTQGEYDAFYQAVAQQAARHGYFYSVTLFAYVGRKVD